MASSVKAASATSSDHSTATDTTYLSGTAATWDGTLSDLASDNSVREVSGLLSSTGNNQTERLDLKNWGFSIPSGATIDGVICRINWSTGTAARSVSMLQVRIVKGGSPTGTNQVGSPASGSETSSSTTDADTVYGSSSSLWGATLADTDVNATNFGVAIQFQRTVSSTTTTVRVDYVEMEVFYTESGGGGSAIAAIVHHLRQQGIA